jgi:hypothetical protein
LSATALQLIDAGVARDESLSQLFVFLVESTQLNDNFVEEVINFVLVVAFTELRGLEPLVDYVFRS